jgi:hypothetical protein
MDVELIDIGNGGDLIKNSKDLSVIFGFENMPYLSMFGGNPEASTPVERDPQEQAFDWWGNSLLFPNDESIQLNSETERALRSVPLTSSGRKVIEEAVKVDLRHMQSFANITVDVSIPSTDRVNIAIKIIRLDNLQERSLVFIWDATNNELIQRA